MSNTRRRIAGALALAVLGLTAGWAAAETATERVERQKLEKRIARVEARLSAVPVVGPKTEVLSTQARTMLDRSRRYLDAGNAAAATVHADVAERLVAIAEGKAVPR
jgi:hypothetical protein